MLLTKLDITAKNIVGTPHVEAQRDTTYDATVGTIIECGKVIESSSYTLKPRGVVWVVSDEEFHLPQNITGLATLKTSWTHDGVLALNVGVIDPKWQGPIATAIVNLSKTNFEVRKGTQFFRILFFQSSTPVTDALPLENNKEKYLESIIQKSKSFSLTFLNIDSLTSEIEKAIFKLPKWAFYIGFGALVVALYAIFFPLFWSVGTDSFRRDAKILDLEQKMEKIQTTQEQDKKDLNEYIQNAKSLVVPGETQNQDKPKTTKTTH